jgi:hypothetical protein
LSMLAGTGVGAALFDRPEQPAIASIATTPAIAATIRCCELVTGPSEGAQLIVAANRVDGTVSADYGTSGMVLVAPLERAVRIYCPQAIAG